MKNRKVIIITMLAVVLILAAIIGVLYFRTDMFKDTETLFYKYLFNTQVFDKEISARYDKAIKNINSSNYSSNGNINCSTAANDSSTNIANIQNLFAVRYNILKNRKLNQTYSDFTVSSNNQDYITLRYMQDGNTYALKADNVVTKYLAVDNSNLKDFFSKLGVKDVTNVPNSIPTNLKEELFNINEESLNNIKTTYGNIIKEKLQADNFNKVRNSNKTIVLEMSLTELEIADMKKTMLETLKNDQAALDIILDKASILGYETNIDSLRTRIQEKIDEITNGTYSSEQALKVAITENGKDTIKIDVKVITNEAVADNQQETKKVETTFSIDLSESNKVTITANDGKNNNVKCIVTFGYEENSITINADIFDLKEEQEKNVGKIQYQINNYDTKNITQNALITLLSDDNTKTQINIDNETQLKEDVQIEKITDTNSTKLNNMSSDNLSQLTYAIIMRLNFLYGNQMNVLNNLMKQ